MAPGRRRNAARLLCRQRQGRIRAIWLGRTPAAGGQRQWDFQLLVHWGHIL